MKTPSPVTAILWDFDGTLVDTRAKNMRVNRRIIEEVTGRQATDFDVMSSQETYDQAQRISVNWREFYHLHFGLSEGETDRAGARWTPYQLADETPTPPLPGILEALDLFDGIPHGVVSQNCSSNITATLSGHGLLEYFKCIIGYTEVANLQQKPAPDGLLLAIDELTGLAPGSVVYVGDHETDLKTVNNANRALQDSDLPVTVVSVAALYGMHGLDESWTDEADFCAEKPQDVVEIAMRLSTGEGRRE